MNYVEGTPFPDMFKTEDDEEDETEEEGACGSKRKRLSQGDIIKIVNGEYCLFGREERAIGYLIISNSCDINNNKIGKILLVPIYSFDRWYDKYSGKTAENLAKELFFEANYKGSYTFFISPLTKFGNKPSIASIDDIKAIKFNVNVFDWADIPGDTGNLNLKRFLMRTLCIDWVETANIEKNREGNNIQVYTENNTLFLILSSDEKEVTLVIDDCRINKFKVIKENNKKIVNFSFEDLLLKYKLCSMKAPWAEQLGHKLGNLFSRVSTYTPNKIKIGSWMDAEREERSRSTARVDSR